ncbi:hypothetical protein [Nonomuraea sp. NPDC003201]
MIIASDPAVIAESCGARALRKLSLRQIAPTVALGALPPEEQSLSWVLGLFAQVRAR